MIILNKQRSYLRPFEIQNNSAEPLISAFSGASTRTASSGSQYSSLAQVEPSPVGNPPVLSINDMTGMSNGSVFHPHSVSGPQHYKHDSLTRKLSLDPHERVKVDKLNSVSGRAMSKFIFTHHVPREDSSQPVQIHRLIMGFVNLAKSLWLFR